MGKIRGRYISKRGLVKKRLITWQTEIPALVIGRAFSGAKFLLLQGFLDFTCKISSPENRTGQKVGL